MGASGEEPGVDTALFVVQKLNAIFTFNTDNK